MRKECLHGEFRPELLSRRGEGIAWGSALLVLAAWVVLIQAGQRVAAAVPFLAIALLLAALSISLGNWVDRRTVIRLEPGGIAFENGLRRVRLGWEEIQQVQVFPSVLGKKVRVLGRGAHFDFRTLREVKVQGELKGRMGFAEGERILECILEGSGLREDQTLTNRGSGQYYVRG